MNIRAVSSAVRTWPLSLGQRGALPNIYDVALFICIAAVFAAIVVARTRAAVMERRLRALLMAQAEEAVA